MAPTRTDPAIPALPETPPCALQSLLAQGVVWQGAQPSDTPLWQQRSTARDVIPFGAADIDECLPLGGLACGAVHELSMNDASGLVTHPFALPALLARNALDSCEASGASGWGRSSANDPCALLVVWIGRRCWPTPFSLPPERLSSCIFVDPPTEKLSLWALETALRSPAVKLVVADTPRVSLATTRRLSLSARAHGTTALLLKRHREQPTPSAAMTSWSLTPIPSPSEAPAWDLSLKRLKGGSAAVTAWTVTVEDDYEHGYRCGFGADLSLRVLPRVVSGSDEAQAPAQKFGT